MASPASQPSSPGSSPGADSTQDELFLARLQALVHLAECEDSTSCDVADCAEVRQLKEHVDEAPGSHHCGLCAMFGRLCLTHAAKCGNAACEVPYCRSLQSRIDHERTLEKPDQSEAAEYAVTFHESCRRAAEAINSADILLVATGAGWSADSGLPTYTDIARVKAYEDMGVTYRDLCVPRWLHENPEIFYGFWGTCFNDYRSTEPHLGYSILRKWRDERFSGDRLWGPVLMRKEMEESGKKMMVWANESGDDESEGETQENPENEGNGGESAENGTGKRENDGDFGCEDEGKAVVEGGNKDVGNGGEGGSGDRCVSGQPEGEEERGKTNGVETEPAPPKPVEHISADLKRPPLEDTHVDVSSFAKKRKLDSQHDNKSPIGHLKNPLEISNSPGDQHRIGGSAFSAPNSRFHHAETAAEPPAGGFFLLTSNVDAHFSKAGYSMGEIYEIHGNAETWQCGRPCCQRIWRLPSEFRFRVDRETMRAEKGPGDWLGEGADGKGLPFLVANHPTCPVCGYRARPAVLFFEDCDWVDNRHDNRVFAQWESAVVSLCRSREIRLVVLEIGCGNRVPSIRHMTERIVAKCGPSTTLIRINPDFPRVPMHIKPRSIEIMSKGLATLEEIDRLLGALERPPIPSDPPATKQISPSDDDSDYSGYIVVDDSESEDEGPGGDGPGGEDAEGDSPSGEGGGESEGLEGEGVGREDV